MGRGLGATLTVLALGLLFTALSVTGASARTVVNASSQAADTCLSKSHMPVRAGRFSGIVPALPVAVGCSDAANGSPPLIWGGGPVMGTASTGPIVVTPIYWHPAGHPMDSAYRNIITTYLAAATPAR